MKKFFLKHFLFLCAIGYIAEANASQFPNYFGNSKNDSKDFLNKEFSYVLNNLRIPYVIDEKTIYDNLFFKKLSEHASACCLGAKIYIGRTTIQSIIGYLYKKLYNSAKKNPENLFKYTSNRIHEHKNGQSKDGNIDYLKILNVGGPLEIFIDFPENTPNEEKETTKNKVSDFANLLKDRWEFSTEVLDDKKNAFALETIVNIYDPKKIKEEGGMSLNRLFFSVSDSKILEIAGSNVLDDLLNGYLSYESGTLKEEPKSIIQAFGALLEIPFLHYKKDSAELLNSCLSKSNFDKNNEDFKNIKLNGRLQSAHNRFKPKENNCCDDEIILQNIEKLNFPTFLQIKLPSSNYQKDKAVKVFHGTPSIKNAIAMYRNGFVCSNNENDTSAYKGETHLKNVDGFYAADTYGGARFYATEYGHVIDFMINDNNENIGAMECGGATHYVISDHNAIDKKKIWESIKKERDNFLNAKLPKKQDFSLYSIQATLHAKKLINKGIIFGCNQPTEEILETIKQLSNDDINLIIKMYDADIIPGVYFQKSYYGIDYTNLLSFKNFSPQILEKINKLKNYNIADISKLEWGNQSFSLLSHVENLDDNNIELLKELIDERILSTLTIPDLPELSNLTIENIHNAKFVIKTLIQNNIIQNDKMHIRYIEEFANLTHDQLQHIVSDGKGINKSACDVFEIVK